MRSAAEQEVDAALSDLDVLIEATDRPAVKAAAAGDRKLEALARKGQKALGKLWRAAVQRIGNRALGALGDKVPSGAEALDLQKRLKMDLSGFVTELVSGSAKAYQLGQDEAAGTLRKAGIAEAARGLREDARTPPPGTMEDALRILESRSLVIAAGMENAVIEAIMGVILNGADQGLTPEQMRQNLDRVLKGLAAGHLISPGTPGHDYRREPIQLTTVRTTYSTAMNRGRLDLYERNADFVRALQIDEVADGYDGDRSHPLSKYLAGLVIATTDQRLRRLTPPNHYNDRAVLIAVTALDDDIELSSDEAIDRALAWKAKLSPNFN